MDPSKDAYRQSVRFNCIPQFYSVNRYNFVKKIIEKMLDYIYIQGALFARYILPSYSYILCDTPPPPLEPLQTQ